MRLLIHLIVFHYISSSEIKIVEETWFFPKNKFQRKEVKEAKNFLAG